jgi:hypothetical protein
MINQYSATTGLVHESNLPRQLGHLEICSFSDLDATLSAIAKSIEGGKINMFYDEPWGLMPDPHIRRILTPAPHRDQPVVQTMPFRHF